MSQNGEMTTFFEKEASNCGIPSDVPHFNQAVHPGPPKGIRTLEAVHGSTSGDSALTVEQEISYLKANSFINPYRQLYSYHKGLEKIVIFIKRVIRKLIKFYIEPITIDQNDRNAHIARTLELMQEEIVRQNSEIVRLRRMLGE